jgi:putative endonuclease
LQAEQLALTWVRLHGYRVLARRWRGYGGELDLVVQGWGWLVFIEVKARPDIASAVAAVDPRAQRRIISAAREFVAAYPGFAARCLRFDLMVIRPWRRPRWIKAAFDTST